MLITGLVWLMSLHFTYFRPGWEVACFHLKRQMNRKDKRQMTVLDILFSWGRSFFPVISLSSSSSVFAEWARRGSPLFLPLKGLAIIRTKALSSRYYHPGPTSLADLEPQPATLQASYQFWWVKTVLLGVLVFTGTLHSLEPIPSLRPEAGQVQIILSLVRSCANSLGSCVNMSYTQVDPCGLPINWFSSDSKA